MKVILKEDISTLGKAGDVVEVARGYGRNYLIPRGKAVEATLQNQKQWEEQRRIILKRKAKDRENAQRLAEQINALQVELPRKVVDEGKLYGSVSAKDLIEKLAEFRISLERKQILLQEPIRSLGQFEVPIKLDPEVTAILKISVVAEP